MCQFYCQLEFWREQAIGNGLNLPKIKKLNKNLTPQEKWRIAINERDRLVEIWRVQASNNGVALDNAEPRAGGQENNEGKYAVENVFGACYIL